MDAHKIFFSYSLIDEVFALKLASDLREAGANIWYDQLDIRKGFPFECVLVIVSSASASSDNVLDAIKYALEKKKRVIPIVINNCKTPHRIKRLQHIDFRNDYIDGFKCLLRELNLDILQPVFVPAQPSPNSLHNLKPNKPVSYFAAGTIVGSADIILFFIYHSFGLSFETNFWSWIPYLLTIGLIIFIILRYSNVNRNNYNLTFGSLFKYGFKTTVIFTLLMTVFFLLILYFFSDYKEKLMEQLNRDEKRDAALIFFHISFVGGSLFSNMVVGTIASLIGAAAAQKVYHGRQRPSDFSHLILSDIVQVSDVSWVTLLRKRLRSAAFFMKMIGIVSALSVGSLVLRLFNIPNAYYGWVALALGIVVFWYAFRVSRRLKAGRKSVTRIVGVWVGLYLAWALHSIFKYGVYVLKNQSDFYTIIFAGIHNVLVYCLPIYYVISGLLYMHLYQTRLSSNPKRLEPLALNLWADEGKGIKKHPIFLNKWSLKAYIFVILAPLLLICINAITRKDLPSSSGLTSVAAHYTVEIIVSMLVYWGMIHLYRRARRHAMLPGSKLLKNDKRDIVLYLRSFLDDSSIKLRAPAHNGRILPERFIKITFEELVTDHLWRYGPVVAYGDPKNKNKLAPLGAARNFEPHDDWEEKIRDLMQKASIIVAVISQTNGFLLEVDMIMEMGLKSKLILLLPPVQIQDLTGRWESLVHHVKDVEFPKKIDLAHTRAVIFKEDKVVLITADKRNGSTYETVLDNAAKLILSQ